MKYAHVILPTIPSGCIIYNSHIAWDKYVSVDCIYLTLRIDFGQVVVENVTQSHHINFSD